MSHTPHQPEQPSAPDPNHGAYPNPPQGQPGYPPPQGQPGYPAQPPQGYPPAGGHQQPYAGDPYANPPGYEGGPEYGDPYGDPYAAAPSQAGPPPGWRTVRTAVLLQLIAMLLVIGTGLINVLVTVSAAGGIRAGTTPTVDPGTASIVQLIGFVQLGAWVLYIVSWGMCLAIPSGSGLRGRAVGAFVCLLAGIALVFVAIFSLASQAMSNPFAATNPAAMRSMMGQTGALMIVAVLLVMIGWFVMVNFLQGIGKALGHDGLASSAHATGVTGLVSFVCLFIPVINLLALFGVLAALVLYLVTLGRAREAITRGPRRRGFARAR